VSAYRGRHQVVAQTLKPVLLTFRKVPFELPECLPELLLRVHHDGPVPGHGLLQRFPETSRKRMPSSPACTMTSSPRSKSTSERFSAARRIRVRPMTGSVGTSRGPDALQEFPRAREYVGERVGVFRWEGSFGVPAARTHRYRWDRWPRRRRDRSFPECSADQAHLRAVIVRDNGNILRLDFPDSAAASSERRRKIAHNWKPCMRPA